MPNILWHFGRNIHLPVLRPVFQEFLANWTIYFYQLASLLGSWFQTKNVCGICFPACDWISSYTADTCTHIGLRIRWTWSVEEPGIEPATLWFNPIATLFAQQPPGLSLSVCKWSLQGNSVWDELMWMGVKNNLNFTGRWYFCLHVPACEYISSLLFFFCISLWISWFYN